MAKTLDQFINESVSPPMKQCTKCGKEKLLTEFYKNNQTKDGRRYDCKDCQKKLDRKRYLKKHPNAKKLYDHSQTPDGFRHCSKCKKTKPLTEFYKKKAIKIPVRSLCKKCCFNYRKKFYKNNKEYFRRKGKEWQEKNKEKVIKKRKKIKEEAISIYGGKCQNKECPYPDINTNNNYLEFHHKYGQRGVRKNRREGGGQVYRRIINNGIQENIELYCVPCHARADIRDKTYNKKKKIGGDYRAKLETKSELSSV